MATIAAVGSFITSNLLDELGMNPTWEKFRKYVYAVCVVISLYPLYLVFELSVVCQPMYSNGTVKDIDSSSKYINAYCRNNDFLAPLRYAGCFLQLANIVILGFSFYWLHLPKVIGSLQNFAKIRCEVEEMHLPTGNFDKHFLTSIRVYNGMMPSNRDDDARGSLLQSNSDTKKSLRKACLLISQSNDIRNHYTCRNILLLFGLFGCAGGLIFLVVCISRITDTFKCSCNGIDCLGEHKCTTNHKFTVMVFIGSFAFGLLLQIFAVVSGISHTTLSKQEGNGIHFMVNLLENAQHSYSGNLRSLVEYFFSEGFRKNAAEAVPVIVENEDFELVNVVGSLIETFPAEVVKYLASSDAKFDESRYINVLQECKYSIDDCESLATLLAKHHLWKVFVKLLENVDLKNDDKHKKKFEGLKEYMDFDSIETPAREVERLSDDPDVCSSPRSVFEERSLLYYCVVHPVCPEAQQGFKIDKEKGVKIATFLLACFRPKMVYAHKISHNRRNSSRVKELIEQCTYLSRQVVKPLREEIERCESTGIGQSNPIEQLLNTYVNLTRDQQLDEAFDQTFSVKVARKKFHQWSEEASKLLMLASKNKHNKTAAALLQAVYSVNVIWCLGNCQSTSPNGTIVLPNRDIVQDAVSRYEYSLDDCKELVKNLAKVKYWRQVVFLLNNVTGDLATCNQEVIDFFKQLNLDVDSLECVPWEKKSFSELDMENYRNLLFYACFPHESGLRHPRPKPAFSVANFLLKTLKSQRLYINLGYRSFPAINYIKSRNVNQDEFLEAIRRFENAEESTNSRIPGQQEIHSLYRRYKEVTERSTDQFENFMADLISSLICIRFQTWDNNVNDFAKIAVQNQHWKVVLCLLNAIIITDNENAKFGILDKNIKIQFPDKIDLIWDCIVCGSNQKRCENYTKAIFYVIRRNQNHIAAINSRLRTLPITSQSYCSDVKDFINYLKIKMTKRYSY